MIVDVHCHFWEPGRIAGGLGDLMDSVVRELRVRDPDRIRDGSAERLMRDMDEAGAGSHHKRAKLT